MKKYTINCAMNMKIFLAARKIAPENYTLGCAPIDAFRKALEMLTISAQRIDQSNDSFEVDMEEHDFQLLTEKCASISIKEYEDYLAYMEGWMDTPAFDSANSCQSFKPPATHSIPAASSTLSNASGVAVPTAVTPTISPTNRI